MEVVRYLVSAVPSLRLADETLRDNPGCPFLHHDLEFQVDPRQAPDLAQRESCKNILKFTEGALYLSEKQLAGIDKAFDTMVLARSRHNVVR